MDVEQLHFYVLYMGEKGLKRVWNVCFLAMATMEGNAGLWEKTDQTVKESTVVPKDFTFSIIYLFLSDLSMWNHHPSFIAGVDDFRQ